MRKPTVSIPWGESDASASVSVPDAQTPASRLIFPLDYARLVANFWKHVEKRGPRQCWPWTGATNSKGYGCLTYQCEDGISRGFLAHRVAWFLETGQLLLPEIQTCHECDFRLCCNRRHFFVGCNSDNILDAIKKGRMRRDVRGLWIPLAVAS